jgi:hypothetical protein
MQSVLNQYVGCNECTTECSVEEAFDSAFRSWPQQSWIAFHCKGCGAANQLQVVQDTVMEGYLDGSPAPVFRVKRIIHIDGFSVSLKDDRITLKNLNLRWSIPSAG